MNLNKVHLIGRVTKEIEVRSTPGGVKVAKFSLATNNTYKNQAGEKVEETDFHNITAFGRTAEVIGEFVVRGQEIYIEGRIQMGSYENKEGVKKYTTDIIVEKFQFGQKPKGFEGAQEPIEDPGPPTERKNNSEEIDVSKIDL